MLLPAFLKKIFLNSPLRQGDFKKLSFSPPFPKEASGGIFIISSYQLLSLVCS